MDKSWEYGDNLYSQDLYRAIDILSLGDMENNSSAQQIFYRSITKAAYWGIAIYPRWGIDAWFSLDKFG